MESEMFVMILAGVVVGFVSGIWFAASRIGR